MHWIRKDCHFLVLYPPRIISWRCLDVTGYCVITPLGHTCIRVFSFNYSCFCHLRATPKDSLSHGCENHLAPVLADSPMAIFFSRDACGALSSRAMCRRRNFWDRFCKGGHVQQPDRAGPLVIFVLVRVSHIRTGVTSASRCYLNSVYAKNLLFSTFR